MTNSTVQIELLPGHTVGLPVEKILQSLTPEQYTQALIANLQTCARPRANRYALGEYVPGQGGHFAGDIRGDDGVTYGLIVPSISEDRKAKWGSNGSLPDLSKWDGLSNTNGLLIRGDSYCAAELAHEFEADGHVDFYLPAQRELMVAFANVPHLFEDGYYWSSTSYGSDGAWIVTFEDGHVYIGARGYEFRFRPFRRFIY